MKVVVVSGYFNPLHCGHLDYLEGAAKYGDRLIVIVNNDDQVKIKGSRSFMNQEDRARIVSAIGCVDEVFLSSDADETVLKSLRGIYEIYRNRYFFESMVFANGGDRNKENSPEEAYCVEEGIATVYNVGGEKAQSSSELLSNIK
jgi:cytidyltransferase-like protein|tara:strand:+ start:56 stop:490 length:435 start_codon:yes stop_codon:yes gene_type:complete